MQRLEEEIKVRFRIANEIPMSAQTLWETAHTPEFCAFLAREYGLIQREMDREIHGDMMHRRIRTVVARSVPEWIGSIVTCFLGTKEITYDEIQEKRLDRFEMCWYIESPVLRDRICCSGTLRLTPVDAECCVRTVEGEILVKLIAIGGTLEKSICKEIKNTAQNLAEVVTKWKALNVKGRYSRSASRNSFQGTCA